MHIVRNFLEIPRMTPPLGLTIGSFDGVHMGHRALIGRLKEEVSPKGSATLLTFKNHPSTILSARSSLPLISTPAHKLLLLKEAGIDLVILLTFSLEIARTPFQEFLKSVRIRYPFSFLILGKGARFGKDREGDEKEVRALAEQWGFTAIYLDPVSTPQGEKISSGTIRKLIEQGELKMASSLLGRPYSLYAPLRGDLLSLEGLCLPPEGSYHIFVTQGQEIFQGEALLTHSPPSITFNFTSTRPSDGLVEVRF
jgi:riboflavin kinase / FMN adenylyltransferase